MLTAGNIAIGILCSLLAIYHAYKTHPDPKWVLAHGLLGGYNLGVGLMALTY